MANPPAFATIGYTVPIGEKTAAEAIASMSQNLQTADTATAMQWKPPISDTTLLLPDGVTVRRMLTYATPKALPSGQFLYPTADTLDGCLRELFTGMLEAYCGAPVTALAPILFDDPVTIFADSAAPGGSDMLSWWTSVQFGSAVAGFPIAGVPNNTPWGSTNGIGAAGVALDQAVGANQFVLGTADALLANALPVVSDGAAAKEMTNALVFAALAQPWSVAIIGHGTGAGSWLGGNGGACELSQDGIGFLTLSTDAGVTTLTTPATDGESHLLMATADGADSILMVDGLTGPTGPAGAGTPTNLTALADAAAANNLAAGTTDIVLGFSGRGWTTAQSTALWAYAQGRYGIGYG